MKGNVSRGGWRSETTMPRPERHHRVPALTLICLHSWEGTQGVSQQAGDASGSVLTIRLKAEETGSKKQPLTQAWIPKAVRLGEDPPNQSQCDTPREQGQAPRAEEGQPRAGKFTTLPLGPQCSMYSTGRQSSHPQQQKTPQGTARSRFSAAGFFGGGKEDSAALTVPSAVFLVTSQAGVSAQPS